LPFRQYVEDGSKGNSTQFGLDSSDPHLSGTAMSCSVRDITYISSFTLVKIIFFPEKFQSERYKSCIKKPKRGSSNFDKTLIFTEKPLCTLRRSLHVSQQAHWGDKILFCILKLLKIIHIPCATLRQIRSTIGDHFNSD